MRCDACGADDDILFMSDGTTPDGLRLCRACASARGYPEAGGSPDPEPACPGCGMPVSELSSAGRLGCARCVPSFRKELSLLWRRAGRPARYAGKVPSGRSGTDALAGLRRELSAALEAEDFERAAAVRDELRTKGGGTSR